MEETEKTVTCSQPTSGVDAAKTLIALYDSGIGGMSVLRTCLHRWPNVHYFYLADTAWCPLGTKPSGIIQQRVAFALNLFARIGAHTAVIACNTASCHGLSQELVNRYHQQNALPVIGTVEAVVMALAKARGEAESGTNSTLLLATEQTLKSNILQRQIKRAFPEISLETFAADPLVGAVEQRLGSDKAQALAISTLSPLGNKAFDFCLLGCTHFPFLKEQLHTILPHTQLIDPSDLIAEQIHLSDMKPTDTPRLTIAHTGYAPLLPRAFWLKNFSKVDITSI